MVLSTQCLMFAILCDIGSVSKKNKIYLKILY